MRKIFCIFILFFVYYSQTLAENELRIISRSEWWADENIRFVDSLEWQKILKKWEEQAELRKNIVYTQDQLDLQKVATLRTERINEILSNYFSAQFELSSKILTENWRKLFWPIEKAKEIRGIVIHHTWNDYKSSAEWIKSIYKYHTLDNAWWDIWYNYLIWNDWEIYEWRAGWDYVVAAHNKYNNTWTVWIAVMWDYSQKPINEKQYKSLENLISSLVKKYNINLTNKVYFHEECIGNSCGEPIISQQYDPIIWHRDAWNTSCPWDELYKQIQEIKINLSKNTYTLIDVSKLKVFKILAKLSDEKLIWVLAKIENDLEVINDSKKINLKSLIIDYFKYKSSKNFIYTKTKDKKIRIKLSYPNNDSISIKSGTVNFQITREWNDLFVKWKKFDEIKVPKKDENSILQITSWDRVPDWDNLKKYNDNQFRGDLVIYAKDNKLIVVNTLYIEDYLKGLWEVSDTENIEKVKTIIISARTYATWYVTKAKKFPGELYDWIDDPDQFQKYLWYVFESRSPNVNKIVEETNGQLITYNWELIKPWYFSNSDWKTLSYYEYCTINNSVEFCTIESKKYPYLQSVIDNWSKWKIMLWHGVWISWAWVKYYALKWWTYDMIIKYFLKWVEIRKI